jgi:elongation factor G
MGVSLLMDFMVHGVRHVQDHRPLTVEKGESPELGEGHPFGARVFKTVVDPYLGKVSLMRVLSGSIKSGANIHDPNHDADIRVSHLYVPNGKDLSEVKELGAGMIGAITKVDEIKTGDTLCDPAHVFQLAPIRFPSPVMALALTPKSRGDEDKMSDGLHKILDADPTLLLERNADTHETVLWGMGHVHLEIAVNALKDRFGVEVETRPPSVAYRETIGGSGDARYRHKKQTGGAGQFAEVALRVAPLARGEGFQFNWKVVGGSIPTQFHLSCEKGVKSALESGVLGGFAVQDVKVEVYDGKDHPVDSKDIAFQIAAAHAFKEAMQQAKPVLLEPVALLKVRVPDRYTGDVISDLNTRRGRILGMDTEGSVSVVSAHVPMAEILSYSPDLRSMTGGRGVFSLKFDHYDVVPAQVAERVVSERQQEKAAS